MTREQAARLTRDTLDKAGLSDWHVRMSSVESGYLGLCVHKDKCIILNALHIDIHPDPEIENTVRHEVAHAVLGPGHGHNEVWQAKARELGCTNTAPCSHLSLSPDIIDAIRSGADVKIEFETEIIHRPKYTVSRLQDKCSICGKVARSIEEKLIETPDPTRPDLKIIKLECGHTEIKKIPKGTPFATLRSKDGKKPYPFQVDGMRFAETALAVNHGVGIFDEMGLGKTIQALGYLRFHEEAFPVLFLVKSGIKFQWLKEILRWMGDIYCPQIIQTSQDILFPQLKCYIASYDILTPKVRNRNGKTITQGFDINQFKERGIKTVVLDECQQIKNPDATRTQMVRRVIKECGARVIAMSGTPWKNRGSELFVVLNMLAPMKFSSHIGFQRRWVKYEYYGNTMKETGIRNIEAFKEYTKDIVIRRERVEVMPELPLVNRTRYNIELDNITQEAYDDEVSDFVKWWNQILADEAENSFETQTNLLARLARMRHITGLAKVPSTMDWLEEFVEETERKVVVFVHHKDVGEILLRECQKKFGNGVNGNTIWIDRLSADMSSEDRFRTQEEFNKAPRAILIASTLASGEGLNLQTCADCIMHERQWNPANEEQAEGRFIRIGQLATSVNAIYATASGTVDDYMDNLIERKRASFYAVMSKSGEAPKWNQTEITRELADIIVSEHEKKHGKIKQLASK